MAVKISLLAVFVIIMVSVGLYCNRKVKDVNGFVLGGRSAGPWITAFSYGTSYFSAVIFIGYAGQFGWKYGLAATWIGIGNALIGSLFAWSALGRRTRVMTQHISSKTMPEFFGNRFESKNLKIFASVLVFAFLIPYTASLFNGLSRLFGMAFGIEYTYCVIAMAVLTGIYVVAGGYMAAAINDLIQGIIMLVGIVAVVVAVLKTQGGFTAAVEALSLIPAENSNQAGAFTSFFGPDLFNLIGVVLLTSLGTLGLPQMIGKFYAIKDEKSIKTGTIVSTVFALVVAGGCYFLGGFGRLFGDRAEYAKDGSIIYDSIVPGMLRDLPDVLMGIVVILVLSASMSTLSSLVLTSSSTITLDFISSLRKKDLKEKSKLSIMRLFVALFIIISATIAIVQSKSSVTFIAQLMGISWGALAGSFLAPFMLALYWKKVTKVAVGANFVVGAGIMILNMTAKSIFPEFLQSPLNAGVLAMLLGFIIVPVVSLLTQKTLDGKNVDKMFECYDRDVKVKSKHILESK
ncbi:MAG: sodium:solute symporter [Ruminococcaceae bacterium]|nr:sodium:solute symporter [Oscillospiraceae bacterium]